MTQVVEATFDGTVFHPVSPLELSRDTRYRLTFEPVTDEAASDGWTLLQEAVGSVEALPDWSQEHGHYLYGTPKKDEMP